MAARCPNFGCHEVKIQCWKIMFGAQNVNRSMARFFPAFRRPKQGNVKDPS